MKLSILDSPDDPEQLTAWLEQRLVTPGLSGLVAELTAVHRPPTAGPALDDLLPDSRTELLTRGLSALSRDQLRQLLRNPNLLLDLQELVCIQGGPYWLTLAGTAAADTRLAGGWDRLARSLPKSGRPRHSRRWFSSPWLVLPATAAAVLLCVLLARWSLDRPAATPTWGWDRPGALSGDLAPPAYLDHLAAGAEEWFRRRPDSAPELARRLLQFRLGCSTLILADHTQLPPADRQWLSEKCGKWAAGIDALVSEVERGDPPLEVRHRADELVRKLVQTLRQRAESQRTGIEPSTHKPHNRRIHLAHL